MTSDVTTVFGGTGFLGSRIAREIAASGRPVRIAARHPVRPAWAGAGDAIELATANIHDETSVARLTAAATPGTSLFELGGARVYRYREIVEQVLEHCGRRRLLMPVPFVLWRILAGLAMLLPNPPLTRDQVLLMQEDNVVRPGAGTFADLGMAPRSLQESLPDCLEPVRSRNTA